MHWILIIDVIALASVCASGKLALTDISTWSTSGPSFAGRTFVLPRDFVGSRGRGIRVSDFFQALWDWTDIALPSCLPNFGTTRLTYTHDLTVFGPPRHLAAGFPAPQMMGALNNLLEDIVCKYINNRNSPRHYFVIGTSSLFCLDVWLY